MNDNILNRLREINKEATELKRRITYSEETVKEYARLHDGAATPVRKAQYAAHVMRWKEKFEEAKEAYRKYEPLMPLYIYDKADMPKPTKKKDLQWFIDRIGKQ